MFPLTGVMRASLPRTVWRWWATPRIPFTRWRAGVNLGFMDAAELIAELKRLHRQGKDIGQYIYLRRYERSRKHSAALMLAGMQGFRDLFSGANPAKKLLRDIGLKLADTLPGVKPQLIRQAMGLNDLPEWLR